MAVPSLNVNDALSQFQQIPAVAQLYEESERPHVERILEANKGTLKTGGTAYRIYASAASYLSTHPQFFVKKHDNTELNDIQKTVDGFLQIQAGEDAAYFLPPAVNPNKFKAPMFMTVSIRGYAEP